MQNCCKKLKKYFAGIISCKEIPKNLKMSFEKFLTCKTFEEMTEIENNFRFFFQNNFGNTKVTKYHPLLDSIAEGIVEIFVFPDSSESVQKLLNAAYQWTYSELCRVVVLLPTLRMVDVEKELRTILKKVNSLLVEIWSLHHEWEEKTFHLCGICLEKHLKKEWILCDCKKHAFGRHCLEQWIQTCMEKKKQATCPICREKVVCL